jgi:hypothetical protein
MFNHKFPKEKLGTLVTKSIAAVQTIKHVLKQNDTNYSVTMFTQRNLNHESIRKQAEDTEGSIKHATSIFFLNTAHAAKSLGLNSSDSNSDVYKE